jgi:hypothetical protein
VDRSAEFVQLAITLRARVRALTSSTVKISLLLLMELIMADRIEVLAKHFCNGLNYPRHHESEQARTCLSPNGLAFCLEYSNDSIHSVSHDDFGLHLIIEIPISFDTVNQVPDEPNRGT